VDLPSHADSSSLVFTLLAYPPPLPCSVPSFSFRERYMRYLREDRRIRASGVGLGELGMANEVDVGFR
jgi:hypothetical protein